jgi:hypothetical protein
MSALGVTGSKGQKLGTSERTAVKVAAGVSVAGLLAVLLGACVTAPAEPVSEKLDPDTATTVTVLDKPVELFDINGRGRDKLGDAFAYLGPFETDRMGARTLFLWVAAPLPVGVLTQVPKVLCNDQPLDLTPLGIDAGDGTAAQKIDLSPMNLSKPPYEAPVPWSGQWYFKLKPDDLKCLGAADSIAVEATYTNGENHLYTGDHKAFGPLGTFATSHH